MEKFGGVGLPQNFQRKFHLVLKTITLTRSLTHLCFVPGWSAATVVQSRPTIEAHIPIKLKNREIIVRALAA